MTCQKPVLDIALHQWCRETPVFLPLPGHLPALGTIPRTLTNEDFVPFAQAGILKDARHLASSVRAAWGPDPEQESGAVDTPSPPPPPPAAPPPPQPPSSLSSSLSSNPPGQATWTPEYASAFSGTSVSTSNSNSDGIEPASLSSLGVNNGNGPENDPEEEREAQKDLNGTDTGSISLPLSGGSGGTTTASGDGGNEQKKVKAPSSKVKVAICGASSAAAAACVPYVPVHGLLFLLCELHMKTPEEILEKVGHIGYSCRQYLVDPRRIGEENMLPLELARAIWWFPCNWALKILAYNILANYGI